MVRTGGGPMKILYADDVRVPWPTARPVQVLKTCSALAAAGADIRLLAQNGSGPVSEIGTRYDLQKAFPISIVPTPQIRYLSSFWFRGAYLPRILWGRQDVVYTRDFGVAALCATLKRPFALEMHSMPVRARQTAMLSRALSSPSLVAVLPITHALARAVQAAFPQLSAERVSVVACGADTPRHPVTPPAEGADFRVAYVGHLFPGKGGETILAMARNNPALTFDIVGDAGEFREALAGLANVVLHGQQTHQAAMVILDRAHAAIAPYSARTEAVDGKVISDWFSPLKIFEYMAHAKAIVSSDLPVIREILNDGETALLVTAGNDAGWSRALTSLAADPVLRTRLATAARTLLEAEYSYDRRAEHILKALERGLG